MKYKNLEYELLTRKYIADKCDNLSKKTIISRTSILNRFGKFIDYKKNFGKNEINEYLSSDYFLNLKRTTQDSHKLTLKKFFIWLGIKDVYSGLVTTFKARVPEIKNNEEKKFENEYYMLVEKYFNEKLSYLAKNSKNAKKAALYSFGKFIKQESNFNKSDLIKYLNSDDFLSLKVSTQNNYKLTLKNFFIWRGIIDIEDALKKTREIRKVMNKTDLLTKDEIKSILKKLNRPVQKAIFILLLETKARKTEILTLKIRDVTFYESYALVYIKNSKSAQRSIPIIESIPYLNRYLEDHPLADDPNACLFGHYYKGEFRRYSKNFINNFLDRNINLNKRLYPHLLRHTGLTEMANHLTEFQLKQLAGWTMDSKQASIYVHLSDDDLKNKFLELHGLKVPEKDDKPTHIELIKCPRCDYTNSELDKYCSRCGSVLDVKTVFEHEEKAIEFEHEFEKSSIKEYIDKIFQEKINKNIIKK